MNLIGIASDAVGEMRNHRLKNLYQKDFIAWQSDVLGLRTYEKMRDICNEALFGEKNRTAIKSSNGVSKSFQVSAMITWGGAVFDAGETLSIITAPSQDQVKRVIWGYMKDFRNRASRNGFNLPGWLNESMEWKTLGPSGNEDIAFGKVPAKGDEVSVFQGTRSTFGRTFVYVEEAGGVTNNLFVAAEAVLTGEDARGIFIGNPDHIGGPWEKLFKDPKYEEDYNLFTVNAYDLPAFTGEVVYPDDPEMEASMLKNLTTKRWVEQKKRLWGEKSPWYLSKVMGEFPEDGGVGFFSPGDIAKGRDNEIEEDASKPIIFGVDIARFGPDESVLYMNQGGRVRLLETWAKTDTYTSSQKIFQWAKKYGPAEIRIDSTGVGGGVYDNLEANLEFAGPWNLVGVEGAGKSPDLSQYQNLRAYIYSSTKEQLFNDELDIDPEDTDLMDEMALITYKFGTKGGVQIAKKEDMKTDLGGSPDRADAFVYATCDLSPWTGNPWNQYEEGTAIAQDYDDVMQFLDSPPLFGAGMPML